MIRLLSIFFVAAAFVFNIGSAKAQTFSWKATVGEPNTHAPSDSVTSICINPNGYIFVGVLRNDGIYAGQAIGVFRSTDHGSTWDSLPNPLNDQGGQIPLGPVYGFTPNGNLIMGSGLGGRALYHSDDTGGNITPDSLEENRSGDPPVTAVAFAPNGQIYVATGATGLYISDANGVNWDDYGGGGQSVGFTSFQNPYPSYVACSPQGILYAANASNLSSETSYLAGWKYIEGSFGGFGDGICFAFEPSGEIVAGGTNGLFLSSDNGNDWTSLANPAPGSQSYALAVAANGDVFCAPSVGGVYLSTDTGQQWTEVENGLNDTYVNCLAIDNRGIVFAGTGNGVSQSVASTGGVNEIPGDLPTAITLEQNHPNPVNSTTTIRFAIPDPATVSIKVYDVTGNPVADLADGFYTPGTYDVSFDASRLPSGMYIYRMESGGQSLSRTFLVLP